MENQQQRRRIFIDRYVQGALLLRAALYWALTLITQLLIVFLYVFVTSSSDDYDTNRARLWWHMQLWIVASSAILPVILLDILKLSHRWVGPVFRVRTALGALRRGEPVSPVRFRENDFWQELAGDLSAVTAELNRHRANSREDDKATLPVVHTSAHEAHKGPEYEAGTPGVDFTAIPTAIGWSTLPSTAR